LNIFCVAFESSEVYFCLDIVATVVIVTIAAGCHRRCRYFIIIAAGSFDGVFYSTFRIIVGSNFGATAGVSILVSSLDFIGMYALDGAVSPPLKVFHFMTTESD
jgi:carbohydrate-binding DOMON domain-containing protein